MQVQPKVSDTNAADDDCRNNAAVDEDTTAQPAIPQRGEAPENNGYRSCDRIDLREGLIDLENALDHDLPLMSGSKVVANHVLHHVGDDESAYSRGDEYGDACKTLGNDCGKRELIVCP
jgi:hypothetical protein